MLYKTYHIIFIFLIYTSTVLAQHKHCGTDHFLQRSLQENPHFWEARKAIETQSENWIKENIGTANFRNNVQIPVVVHVVWNEDEENISEEQILSQIDVLNQDFNATNTDLDNVPANFQHLIADIEIEFCLASTDPEGNPTNGITRRFTTVENIAFKFGGQFQRRVKYENLGGADAWNPLEYLNIWVSGSDMSFVGDATFPGQTFPEEEGVVIDYRFFGTTGAAADNQPNHLGRTATHEVGHYLNLQHLWGTFSFGCSDDDGVWDTPNQENFYFGCPNQGRESCGSTDMFMNFMNFSFDECLYFFTEGQKWRMLAAINGPRSSLLSSGACGGTAAAVPSILANEYTVYPNPASNILNVYIQNISQLEFLELFSTDYKIVRGPAFLVPGKLHQLDLTHVPAGIYILHIRLGGESIYEKLVITK